jgi:acetoin utilization deacetylase AcuC-like enzyme
MTERMLEAAARLCDGRLALCHEGGYSTTYVPYCGLAIVETLRGVKTGVVDPWISDSRRVRELPLRCHEQSAIDAAVRRHGL